MNLNPKFSVQLVMNKNHDAGDGGEQRENFEADQQIHLRQAIVLAEEGALEVVRVLLPLARCNLHPMPLSVRLATLHSHAPNTFRGHKSKEHHGRVGTCLLYGGARRRLVPTLPPVPFHRTFWAAAAVVVVVVGRRRCCWLLHHTKTTSKGTLATTQKRLPIKVIGELAQDVMLTNVAIVVGHLLVAEDIVHAHAVLVDEHVHPVGGDVQSPVEHS